MHKAARLLLLSISGPFLLQNSSVLNLSMGPTTCIQERGLAKTCELRALPVGAKSGAAKAGPLQGAH